MHDKPYNSPSPLQHTASNPSCPKVMAVTTGIITHFSFCAAASLYSPPCPHEICLHPAVPEYIYQVHSVLFSGWLCWNERPLLDLFTNCACEHTFVPARWSSPPVLLSISGGSRVVVVDGCWQHTDCWGIDGCSSRGDRMPVSLDPLKGIIRLFWKLLPVRRLPRQMGRCSNAN